LLPAIIQPAIAPTLAAHQQQAHCSNRALHGRLLLQVNDLVSSPAERERLFAEIRVLKQLKHKNIMTFYDSWLDQKNMTVNFITELFTSGTLRQ
jgi:serine/threonine protein kinase